MELVTVIPAASRPTAADLRAAKLAAEIREAEDEAERGKLREQLLEALDTAFEERRERQSESIGELEKQLEELRTLHQQRGERKGEIVQRRLSELLSEPDVLAWEPNYGAAGDSRRDPSVETFFWPDGTKIERPATRRAANAPPLLPGAPPLSADPSEPQQDSASDPFGASPSETTEDPFAPDAFPRAPATDDPFGAPTPSDEDSDWAVRMNEKMLLPLMIKREQLASQLGSRHPSVKQLDKQIEVTREKIEEFSRQQTERISELRRRSGADKRPAENAVAEVSSPARGEAFRFDDAERMMEMISQIVEIEAELASGAVPEAHTKRRLQLARGKLNIAEVGWEQTEQLLRSRVEAAKSELDAAATQLQALTQAKEATEEGYGGGPSRVEILKAESEFKGANAKLRAAESQFLAWKRANDILQKHRASIEPASTEQPSANASTTENAERKESARTDDEQEGE